jgi:nondiscriminating aspartyl-tRNA synthetase
MMVGVFERVYETGPFSAPSRTTRRGISPSTPRSTRMGFIHDHFEVMTIVREALAGMVAAIRGRAQRAVELLEAPPEVPCVHFADTGVEDVDLAPADERRLCEQHGEWLFVTGFPMAKRPFYTHPEPAGRSTRIRSTCSSGVWRSSPAASAHTFGRRRCSRATSDG